MDVASFLDIRPPHFAAVLNHARHSHGSPMSARQRPQRVGCGSYVAAVPRGLGHRGPVLIHCLDAAMIAAAVTATKGMAEAAT